MATSSNPQYSLSEFFPLETYTLEDGTVEECIDFFNPKGAQFVASMQTKNKFAWNKSYRLDVMAHEAFGSVSAWWIMLFFIGEMHPDELKTGAIVAMPSTVSRIESGRSRSPGRGSRVRV